MKYKEMCVNLIQILELVDHSAIEQALEKADLSDSEWENTLKKLAELETILISEKVQV